MIETLKKPTNTGLERRKMIKYLDDLVSKIVRLRDKRCVTCGSVDNATCSHLFKRGDSILRFDLINCNQQCVECNGKHEHTREPYERWWKDRYGENLYNQYKGYSYVVYRWKLYELKEKKQTLLEIYKRYKNV